MLANPENHKNWATVVSLDVKEHVHSLKSTVYQVKGQINGQTILPMPVGVERLESIEKTVKERHVIILKYLSIFIVPICVVISSNKNFH